MDDRGGVECKQVSGRTYYPITRIEVDFDAHRDVVSLLPTFYAFGCEYGGRGLMLDRDDAFRLIAAIEKALSVEN